MKEKHPIGALADLTSKEMFNEIIGPDPEGSVNGDSPPIYSAGDPAVRLERCERVYRRVIAAELGIDPDDVELPFH